MGLFKKLSKALGFTKENSRILVVGLDNSGKTTLINHLKPKKGQAHEVAPTVGFTMEEFSKKNLNFTIFDMSGQSKYRSLWESYYAEVEAIIFVLDSTDEIRMCVAKDELDTLVRHPDIAPKNLPLLVFANKMDKASALSAAECMEQLQLDKLSNMPYHITASNAISGSGVDEGIDWLADQLHRARK